MKNLQKITSSFLKYFSVIFFLQIAGVIANECKTMSFLPEKPDRYLRNHVIQNMTVSSQSMCRVMCYLNDSCLSYNYHLPTGRCEISNSDELKHPDDIISDPDYLYRGTRNDCKDNTCPSNSTCQAIFTTNGGYFCLCPSGFTGIKCETDIDECSTGIHNCPINTKCKNTVGSFECIPLGAQQNPAKSCLHILQKGFSHGSGEYWLDPTNTQSPNKVLCDMTTDGGGWTVIKKLVQPSRTVLPGIDTKTYDEVMKEYSRADVNAKPEGAAMLDIKNKMGFHQIHFYCHKVSVGRVVSIMTKNKTAGQAVLSFFTNPGGATSFPAACGSFDRLPEDTSFLSRNCSIWGGQEGDANPEPLNTWGAPCCGGAKRMAGRSFQIAKPPSRGFEFAIYFLCDNEVPLGLVDAALPDVNDTWQISVR